MDDSQIIARLAALRLEHRDLDSAIAALAGETVTPTVFPGRMAFNVLCDWKAGENDYSEEELKMVNETRKIMESDSIDVCPTCVRVPVVNSHSESIMIETERPISPESAREAWKDAPGLIVVDDPANRRYPLPLDADGRDEVAEQFVCRVGVGEARTRVLLQRPACDTGREAGQRPAVELGDVGGDAVALVGWDPTTNTSYVPRATQLVVDGL